MALLAAVLLAVVVAVAAGALDRGPTGPTARDAVESVLAEQPTTPVVLPVEPPAGYVLRAGDTVSPRAGQQVARAAWVFDPPEGATGLAIVQVCVSRAPGGCSSRLPAEAFARQVDGLDVAVIPFGPQPDAAAAAQRWREVELTTRWTELDWLD